MKVATTFEVDDAVRRAIRVRVGRRGNATPAEVEAEIHAIVAATFEDYRHENELRANARRRNR